MMQRFDNTIERTAPARQPSIRADVGVPLLQSLVTGVLIGSPLGMAAWAVGGHPIVIPALIFVASAAAWFLRLRVIDATLQATEARLGVDIDGDGQVAGERIIGLNAFRGRQARNEAEHDAQASRLAEFIRESYSNTSMAYLEGRGFDRAEEIQPWRDMLIRTGWARWNGENHTHGWRFCEDVALDEVLGSLVEM
jgi:hypothetical protein